MINGFDKGITLSRLERLKRSQQAVKRIACWVAIVLGIPLFSPAYAVAPIHAHIQIKQTPQAYAKAHLPLHEYKCIKTLYYYESRWNYKSYNKSSGAAGIPQGKSVWLRSATPIEQIKWGLSYIENRYKTPCSALNHFRKFNWH